MRGLRLALAVALVAPASLVIAGSAASIAPPHPACAPLSPGDHLLAVSGDHPPVLVHVPPAGGSRRALVLALPGAGQTGRDFANYTGYSHLADLRGFSVAYPTATGTRPFWNVSGTMRGKPDDVAYLRAVIPAVTTATCADARRVGATGVSNGGGMTGRLACDASDLIAAAAPVAGGYSTLPYCRPAQPVALLEVHSLTDYTVPYGGRGATHAGDVTHYVTRWRRIDACPGTRIAPSSPAPGVTEWQWRGCAGGTAVIHDRIVGAEHGWPGEDDVRPGREFSSTRRTWAFLSAFRR